MLRLELLPGQYAVIRMDPDAHVPRWAFRGAFSAVTRTPEELSIVVEDRFALPGERCETGFRLLRVQGKLDFRLTGVLAAISAPLSRAEVSVFAVSTYDTDYLLVAGKHLGRAKKAWKQEGIAVRA
jgi:uncharacterized protein